MKKKQQSQLNKSGTLALKGNSKLRYTPTKSSMPKLSLKSSFLVIGVTFIVLFTVPFLLEQVQQVGQWLVLIASAMSVGLSIAYAHYFIETKRGIGSGFWKLAGIITLLVFIVEFFLFGLGIYL